MGMMLIVSFYGLILINLITLMKMFSKGEIFGHPVTYILSLGMGMLIVSIILYPKFQAFHIYLCIHGLLSCLCIRASRGWTDIACTSYHAELVTKMFTSE
jgi:hypothetical protein